MGSDKRKITVSGNSETDVDEAIEEILLERVVIPLESSLIECICGQNDSNLTFFQEKSGAVQISIDQDSSNGKFAIVAIGTRKSIEDLRTMV